jgi:uncharacterized protein YndB with AHSA1/START domain
MEATATRHIDAPPEAVAKTMFDPRRDPEWIGGAKSVDPPRPDPTKMGSHTTRHGGFLGKKFSWETEVAEFEPDRLLRMNFVAGPMKGGNVTYQIEPDRAGSKVSIRNTGPGPGFMSWFVKRSVGKDLSRLAKLVER